MFFSSTGPVDAPIVVLLHGGGVAGWMWDPVRDRLQDGHRVLVVDLPGHGRSADHPYTSHDETVRSLAELIAAEAGTRPVAVVGFSLGAQVAVQLAARHPGLVDRVVVVSAQAARIPFSRALVALASLAAPLARRSWFARLQARELFIPAEMMDRYIETSAGITRDTLRATLHANMFFRIPDEWSRYPGRAVVVVGSRERGVMRRSASALHDALPSSALIVADGCGHGAPLQRPDWFVDRLAEWIA